MQNDVKRSNSVLAGMLNTTGPMQSVDGVGLGDLVGGRVGLGPDVRLGPGVGTGGDAMGAAGPLDAARTSSGSGATGCSAPQAVIVTVASSASAVDRNGWSRRIARPLVPSLTASAVAGAGTGRAQVELSPSRSRSRLRAWWSRDLTVPSGSSRSVAISWYG